MVWLCFHQFNFRRSFRYASREQLFKGIQCFHQFNFRRSFRLQRRHNAYCLIVSISSTSEEVLGYITHPATLPQRFHQFNFRRSFKVLALAFSLVGPVVVSISSTSEEVLGSTSLCWLCNGWERFHQFNFRRSFRQQYSGKTSPFMRFPLVQLPKKFQANCRIQNLRRGGVSISSTSEEVLGVMPAAPMLAATGFHQFNFRRSFRYQLNYEFCREHFQRFHQFNFRRSFRNSGLQIARMQKKVSISSTSEEVLGIKSAKNK